MAESRTVVIAALFANGAIAVMKFAGFLLTGSPAMLSETYHSISDTGNQVFLLIGIWYGNRARTQRHPFGYGKAQFFYSFLVSVLLFGIAGWESARHGYDALVHHETALLTGTVTVLDVTFPATYVNYGVLIAAIGFESYAFTKAYQGMKADIDEHAWSGFAEAFKKTTNVTTLTAFTEDLIALVGLVLALAGITLSQVTDNPVYDAAAAFLIGLILMGFAVALAWENKRLLLGESLPEAEERRIRDIVENTAGVVDIVDLRSVHFGPEAIVVTADVAFDADLDVGTIDDRITSIKTRVEDEFTDVHKMYVEPETGSGAG